MKRFVSCFRPVLAVYALLALVTVAAYFADDAANLIKPAFVENSLKIRYVLDPGHGGEDGGACLSDGTRESDLNLSVAQKLDLVLRFFGRHTVMTRSTDEIRYPSGASTTRERKRADLQMRVQAANDTPNAVFISLHQNKYSDPRPFGAQVLYNDPAAQFGRLLQDALVSSLMPENYREAVKAADDIYVMAHVRCPAVLVECGFLSNEEELQLLRSNEYQLRLAAVIAACSIQNEAIFKNYYSGGTNESQNSVLLY